MGFKLLIIYWLYQLNWNSLDYWHFTGFSHFIVYWYTQSSIFNNLFWPKTINKEYDMKLGDSLVTQAWFLTMQHCTLYVQCNAVMQAVWPQTNILQVFVSTIQILKTTFNRFIQNIMVARSAREFMKITPATPHHPHPIPFWCMRPCLHRGFLRPPSGVICTSYNNYREDFIISRAPIPRRRAKGKDLMPQLWHHFSALFTRGNKM